LKVAAPPTQQLGLQAHVATCITFFHRSISRFWNEEFDTVLRLPASHTIVQIVLFANTAQGARALSIRRARRLFSRPSRGRCRAHIAPRSYLDELLRTTLHYAKVHRMNQATIAAHLTPALHTRHEPFAIGDLLIFHENQFETEMGFHQKPL